MKKSLVRIIGILLCILFASSNILYAANANAQKNTPKKQTIGNIGATDWEDWTEGTSNVTNQTEKVMATAIRVVQIVTMGISVIMMLIIAIKYMSASPEGKADFKKSATGYIVGAVVMFGVSGLLKIIQSFSNSITNTN